MMFINNHITIRLLIFVLTIVLVLLVSIWLYIYSNTQNTPMLESADYRTDLQPLIDRFGEIIDIEKCFWKADVFNKRGIGPSSYWMKGYILISQENADVLKSQYIFSDIDISFENGMSPDVTQKDGFKWSYNKELSRKIIGTGFIGEFYFDVENNIFYFDLESS